MKNEDKIIQMRGQQHYTIYPPCKLMYLFSSAFCFLYKKNPGFSFEGAQINVVFFCGEHKKTQVTPRLASLPSGPAQAGWTFWACILFSSVVVEKVHLPSKQTSIVV
jgi:hypothetical protein